MNIKTRFLYDEVKRPISYEEWLEEPGIKDEIGCRVLVTHKILGDSLTDRLGLISTTIQEAFANSLSKKGAKPLSLEVDIEDNISYRAKEITAIIKTEHGASLQEFAGVVYNHAQEFYRQVREWEDKSFWEYITWWIKRVHKNR